MNIILMIMEYLLTLLSFIFSKGISSIGMIYLSYVMAIKGIDFHSLTELEDDLLSFEPKV